MKEAMTKESMEPLQVGQEKENFANRKLIRPTLPRVENHAGHNAAAAPPPERPERHGLDRGERMDRPSHDRPSHDRSSHDRTNHGDRGDRSMGGGGVGGKKTAPPEQTNAENFYYQKQMQSRMPMVIVLRDGEEVHGIIEWYDKNCIKVNRDSGSPNLMIYKPAIKYMYKEGENQG
jgi:host factor-I protein